MEQQTSVLEKYKEKLGEYETRMGKERALLVQALDLLTEALIVVGQHSVYCRNARDPEKPKLDLEMLLVDIEGAKELVARASQILRQ